MNNKGISNIITMIVVAALAVLAVNFILMIGSIIIKVISLIVLGLVIAFMLAYISQKNNK